MSQLPRRANTFCGCCSDAQKYAINSIPQAIRLQASKGREEYAGGGAHRVALTCSKKQNPSLACKLELGNNFSLDLAAQPVCNILCCIVAASAPFLPQIQPPSTPRPGCHIAATSYVCLMCRQAGKGWHRKRIQRAANVASQCYVPSRPDRKSSAGFSKVPFTLLLTL